MPRGVFPLFRRAACIDAIDYRYASLAEALNISQGSWSFARPTLWPDKYERHLVERLFGAGERFEEASTWVKCVSLEYSTEAMWRTYGTNGGLVRLSWRLNELVDAICNVTLRPGFTIYIGRVRYLKEQDLRTAIAELRGSAERRATEAARAVMHKRIGFSYENEVRICLVGPKASRPQDTYQVEGIFPEGTSTVLIDPYLPEWQAKSWTTFLSPFFKGRRVRQSAFNKDPSA